MCVQQLINAGELAPYIGLRPRLTRLLELLAKYAGEKTQQLCCSQETLAAHLSCSVRTISRDLHTLSAVFGRAFWWHSLKHGCGDFPKAGYFPFPAVLVGCSVSFDDFKFLKSGEAFYHFASAASKTFCDVAYGKRTVLFACFLGHGVFPFGCSVKRICVGFVSARRSVCVY